MISSSKHHFAEAHGMVMTSSPQERGHVFNVQEFHPSFPIAGLDGASNETCPNCSYTAKSTPNFQSHLAACARINRNLDGARRDKDVDLAPHLPVLKRKRDGSDEG